MNIQTIARKLHGRKTGGSWIAHCPVHTDCTPSLSLANGDKGLLVYFFAGCGTRDILRELRKRGLLNNDGETVAQEPAQRPVDTWTIIEKARAIFANGPLIA